MTAEVHHGDALELVPDLGEFDVVMSDPALRDWRDVRTA